MQDPLLAGLRPVVTTFGSPMSLGDDARIAQAFALGAWPTSSRDSVLDRVKRDMAVTAARWHGAVHSASGDYVPGDVLRLRSLAGSWLLHLVTSERINTDGNRERLPESELEREWVALELLYASVPYVLTADAALGIMASQPPDTDLLHALQLPYPAVVVFFSQPFQVPDELVGGEERLAQQWVAPGTIHGLLTGEEPDPEQAPQHIRFGTIAAYRRNPLSVTGVVLTAGLDGSLGDLVVFVLAAPTARSSSPRTPRRRSSAKSFVGAPFAGSSPGGRSPAFASSTHHGCTRRGLPRRARPRQAPRRRPI
jgi:hypothetical protein